MYILKINKHIINIIHLQPREPWKFKQGRDISSVSNHKGREGQTVLQNSDTNQETPHIRFCIICDLWAKHKELKPLQNGLARSLPFWFNVPYTTLYYKNGRSSKPDPILVYVITAYFTVANNWSKISSVWKKEKHKFLKFSWACHSRILDSIKLFPHCVRWEKNP